MTIQPEEWDFYDSRRFILLIDDVRNNKSIRSFEDIVKFLEIDAAELKKLVDENNCWIEKRLENWGFIVSHDIDDINNIINDLEHWIILAKMR